MNIIPLLTSLWAPLGLSLFSLWGADITPAGLLLMLVVLLLASVMMNPFGRMVQRLAMQRGVADARVQRLIFNLGRLFVVLLCLGLGLDLGNILSLGRFLDGFFEVFRYPLFQLGGKEITLTTLGTVAAIIYGSRWTARLINAALHPVLELRLDPASREGTIRVIERLTNYAIFALGMIIALQTAGVDLSALLATGAAFAVGLSLAMQSMAQSFISGLILLFERAIKPGDILSLDGQPVRVRNIGIRSTVVRTLNDEDIIVPNARLVDDNIINYTFSDTQLRVRALVGVTYDSDLRLTEQVLHKAAAEIHDSESQTPTILLHDFGASSVDFEVSIWIQDPWRLRRTASDLRKAIWWALKDAGIVIAFPQLDVHFDASIEKSLRVIRGGQGTTSS